MASLFVLAIDQPSSNEDHSNIHWAILIEPRRQNRLISFNSKPYAFDAYQGTSRLLANPDGLRQHTILKIHISDLKSSASLSQAKEKINDTRSSTSEAWLLAVLALLQSSSLVDHFSKDKFLHFAKDTVDTHRSSYKENVEEIDYIALLKSNRHVKQMLSRNQDTEELPTLKEKKGFLGFRVSTPGNPRTVHYNNGPDRGRDPYGGLM